MKAFLATLWLTTNALMAATSDRAANSIPTDGLGNAIRANAAGAAGDADGAAASARPKPTADEHRAQKSRRMADRRERVRRAIANLPNEPESMLHPMSAEELDAALEATQRRARERFGDGSAAAEAERNVRRARKEVAGMSDEERRLWGSGSFGGSSNGNPYAPAGGLVTETEYFDKWQQAYRFLGGYIDCANTWGGGSHDGGNNDGEELCSRWMMWAAYIDPNYAGGGYDEYFGDNAEGTLDCHSPDTDWKLIGVYRQEFYQYVEQISKHLWAIDDYEYIVALAGLEYMTDDQCVGVGYDEQGNQLYADVQPIEGGAWQMGLYSDARCIELNSRTSYTYDDFAEKSDLDLGSKDATDDDAFHQTAYSYWQDTQEYTLTNLNTVYNDYKFCTSCVDYPTYQDGYFIGDDGTEDDDLINQCWKFYSHDSFNCDSDCIAMGAEQGTIAWISYNGKSFGTLIDGQYEGSHDNAKLSENGIVVSTKNGGQRMERLKANLFLTFAGIVFVATFLAFAVARGSSKKSRKSRSSRSRRLLDDDYGGRRSSRSASRRKTGDKSVRSSRSKSRARGDKSVKSSRSKSKTRRSSSEREYVPPSSSEKRRSQSRSRKSSSSGRRRDRDEQ